MHSYLKIHYFECNANFNLKLLQKNLQIKSPPAIYERHFIRFSLNLSKKYVSRIKLLGFIIKKAPLNKILQIIRITYRNKPIPYTDWQQNPLPCKSNI